MKMKSSVMGSLEFQFPQLGFLQNLSKPHPRCSSMVSCGLRGGPRKPLWRKSVLSSETIQVVHSLKLAKSSTSRLQQVFSGRLSRLLKADLLDTLAELHRQNELDLALKVFQFVRKEEWYQPDLPLYCDMILLLGKNKLTDIAGEFFSELKKEGLQPNTRAFTEMIGAYIRVDMTEKAMETYELMKASGCAPDRLTFMILIRNLEKAGKEELAAMVKKECVEYVDSPERFLEEVEQHQRGNCSILRENFQCLELQTLDWSTLVHLAALNNRHCQALIVACCQQIRDYEESF